MSHSFRRAVAAGSLILGGVALTALPASAHGHPHESVMASSHPSRVLADGKSTTNIHVRILHQLSAPGAITLATADFPSGSGACGTLGATSGTASHHGRFSTTYTASSVVGFCTVTVTADSATTSFVIDQIDPTQAAADNHYTLTLATSAHSIKADGTSTSTITATVTNGATPVSGDPVNFVTRAVHAGSCGAIVTSGPSTDVNGVVTFTYTSSTHRGICLIRVREAATSASNLTPILQHL